MVEKKELNYKCLNYYSSEGEMGFCKLYREYFKIDDKDNLTPNCHKCVKDLEMLLGVIAFGN